MIWGVTGCVGAGKSTVAALLAGFGAEVLDVDRLAAATLAESGLGLSAAEALTAVVGGGAGRQRIEAMVVPRVLDAVANWCARTPLGVVDAALLFEHGLERHCDLTLCVCCPVELRRERVSLRRTASSGLFAAIEASQWPEADKARAADHRIGGDRPLDELSAELLQLWKSAGVSPP